MDYRDTARLDEPQIAHRSPIGRTIASPAIAAEQAFARLERLRPQLAVRRKWHAGRGERRQPGRADQVLAQVQRLQLPHVGAPDTVLVLGKDFATRGKIHTAGPILVLEG